MNDRQARVCVYCAAVSMGLSFVTLVLVIVFSIGFQQTISERDRQHDKDISTAKAETERSLRIEIQTWQAYVNSLKESMIRSGMRGIPLPPK